MSGFRNNPTTTGTPANVPVGTVAVPNHSNGDLTALRGASASTDGNGNETAAVAVVIENVTALGQATSANSSPVVLASDQSNVPVKPGIFEQAGLTAGSLNADLIPALDTHTLGLKAFSIHINTNAYNGSLTFQCSNDNVNWPAMYMERVDLPGNSNAQSVVASQTNVTFAGNIKTRYIRVRMTSYTSGTAQAVAEFYTLPFADPAYVVAATQSGTWTVQPGNTQNTTPWLMAGPNANGTQAANSAANTVIKGSPGWLYHAIVTTLGTAGLTIYDNASTNSGTQLLVIPASAAAGTIYSFPSGARAVNGITSAGVTNCPAVTFHYT